MFRDITPLLRHPDSLSGTIDQLAERCSSLTVDAIAGIESRGFVFATALAVKMGLGLIPIRKKGKLPCATHTETYELEYGTDALEVHKDAAEPGQRIVLVDDLLATGGTMAAAHRLIEQCRAEVVASLFVIELADLQGRRRLPDGATIEALVSY